MVHQHSKGGIPRFAGEEALYVLKNIDDDFMQFLLNEKNHGEVRNLNVHRFNGAQICNIYSFCNTNEQKDFARKLIIGKSENFDSSLYLSPEQVIDILNSDINAIVKHYSNDSEKFKLLKIFKLLDFKDLFILQI